MIKPIIFYILACLPFIIPSYGSDNPENKETKPSRSAVVKKGDNSLVIYTLLAQVLKEAQFKRDEEAHRALKFVEEELLSLEQNPSEETLENSARK